ncbi:unnamed protein product [Darwinula stevensoni]|uniref:SH3 domain-binding glutamic acid-rich-like protein n=1 Tax=Darwinula stevensoni TaxID=69355 RepID=A0A7R8X5D5_9CRUS|nr:unnamed protein product [Darwinula stevensoni]CAG0885836.1 unnamed protein product [Darwinula stevensoni]
MKVKKRQQRVMLILDSRQIHYDVIDIADPSREEEKAHMQQHAKPRSQKHPLPPQIFNESEYCGDYEDFDEANEVDQLDNFLKLSEAEVAEAASKIKEFHPIQNGLTDGISSKESSIEKETRKWDEAEEIEDVSHGSPLRETSPPSEEIPIEGREEDEERGAEKVEEEEEQVEEKEETRENEENITKDEDEEEEEEE